VKRAVARWLLWVLLGTVLSGVSGCATDEPQNESVRPWNSPQGWEGSMPMMNQQHQ